MVKFAELLDITLLKSLVLTGQLSNSNTHIHTYIVSIVDLEAYKRCINTHPPPSRLYIHTKHQWTIQPPWTGCFSDQFAFSLFFIRLYYLHIDQCWEAFLQRDLTLISMIYSLLCKSILEIGNWKRGHRHYRAGFCVMYTVRLKCLIMLSWGVAAHTSKSSKSFFFPLFNS